MRHVYWEDSDTYPVAVLIKRTAFNQQEILKNYIEPLKHRGIPLGDMIAFTLEYNESNKAPAGLIKEHLASLLLALESLGTQYLYVADTNYFKVLAGQSKADPHHGYVLPCKVKGYEHMKVVLGLNYQQLIYNPDLQAKLDLSLHTLASGVNGTYQAIGTGIVHSAKYPESHQDIAQALEQLHRYPRLACDIEGFSLDFDKAGVGTIAFAWDEHNGIAFACDCGEYIERPAEGYFLYQASNYPVRELLRQFFESYQGDLTWHNGAYDIKVLIYNLWMKSLLDTEGLLRGLEIMTRRVQDTKIIAYLATNSTAGNVLGLKPLAHEFAGNWAVEVKDIRKVPLKDLLQYNLVDALSTNYVREKYYPTMVADQQEELYYNLMLPTQKLLLQTELTGMPLNPEKVKAVRAKLEAKMEGFLDVIRNNGVIKTLDLLLQQTAWEDDYESRKAKAKNPDKIKQKDPAAFSHLTFNPNSGPQLQRLLYEVMGLPVIDKTDTGQPATGAETLEKLINHTQEPSYKKILEALIGYGKVAKILGTFIPAFERAIEKGDGIVWLHGSFNIGGAVSGRLSSSDPNLQNLPAGTTGDALKQELGKLIKDCFEAPAGWLFCGADFNSLEDYISALTTRDPNKLAVYERGFDGHCLRAAYYFRDQLIHIDLDDPDSVNSIKNTHPTLRQKAKNPTFALTYQGTWHTLVNTLGFKENEAKMIEKNYHELYKVSDAYVQARIKQAAHDGYVAVAFGLRIRTPLLKQVIWGGPKVPYEAAAEGRTAGNALGQSYGLLNNRAAVEFMEKVWASKYRLDVKPVALIHDAIYLVVRDNVEVVEWVNRELIKSMQWQELPELQHDTVKLGAALDIYWPSWANPITLPNDADRPTLIDICNKAKEKNGNS